MRILQKLLLLLGTLSSLSAFAQFQSNIEVGAWRFHTTLNTVLGITESDRHIYSYSPASLLRFDKQDLSIEILDKTKGFSDLGVTAVAYDQRSRKVVVGYETGAIDIIDPNDQITVLSTIKNSNAIVGSKRINSIFCHQGVAYICADFGLLEFDLIRDNVINLYRNIGREGAPIAILDGIIVPQTDTIMLCSSQGVIAGSINRNSNRLDWRQWLRYGTASNAPQAEVQHIVWHNGAAHIAWSSGNLLRLENTGSWTKLNNFFIIGQLKNMRSLSTGRLLLFQDEGMLELNAQSANWDTITISGLNFPSDILFVNNQYYVASSFSGISRTDLNFNAIDNLSVNTPSMRDPFYLYTFENNCIFLAGGYNRLLFGNTGSILGLSLFNNVFWANYSSLFGNVKNRAGNDLEIMDPVRAYYHPNGNLYLASYSKGIYRFGLDGNTSVFNATNSPVINTFALFGQNAGITSIFNRMSTITGDESGDLWAYNYVFGGDTINNNFVHRFKLLPNGDIDSARSVRYTFGENFRVVELIIDDFGNKWTIQQSPNIIVFKDTSNAPFGYTSRTLSEAANQGNLPSSLVICMTKDRQGDIWIGTSEGVAVFFGSNNVMRGNVNASLPIFDRRPLLNGQSVNSIAVDGGNRKWLGTNSGLFLVSPDGSKLIQRFTSSNSPLPSDNIIQIQINQVSGEVWIKTDRGVVSYRGDATMSTADAPCDKIMTFPNPVRESRGQDLVTLSGLQEDAIVKITDISGKLIFETKANGGTATWNTRNYNGEKARAGVYLVFSGPEKEGKGCATGKIAIVD